MKINFNQIFSQGLKAHQEGRLKEAEQLYREALKAEPKNLYAYNNLGTILQQHGKVKEAEKCFKKAIEFKPDYAEAHNNLGIILNNLGKFDEAETSFKKAIELKPNYAEAYNNLGILLYELDRFNETEENYKKAIEFKLDYAEAYYNLGVSLQEVGRLNEAEKNFSKALKLKPDYAEAYNNLGIMLNDMNKFDEAEKSYKKAIEFKPDYETAQNNLEVLLKEKDLLIKISQTKRSVKENKQNNINSSIRLTSNPFITHRNVEKNIFKDLYKNKFKKLNKTEKKDARYGNGKCSDFKFFKNDFPITKNIEADLINIMSKAVRSDIFIFDSFLNIYGAGSGTTPHSHIMNFDKIQGLVNQKYSLTYYLSVGNQNCSEPGNLQLYNPYEEIKLSEGMLVIIPANRLHNAVYNGEKDRVMIGVNFYSLI